MFKVYCIIGLYNSVLYNSVLIGLPDPLLEPMEEVGTEGRGEEREGGQTGMSVRRQVAQVVFGQA